MKNKFLLLSAALIIASTPMLAGTVSTEVNAKNVLLALSYSQDVPTSRDTPVTLQEVQMYMYQYGFHIVCMKAIDGTENVIAIDAYNKSYIIYISNNVIIGWDENF